MHSLQPRNVEERDHLEDVDVAGGTVYCKGSERNGLLKLVNWILWQRLWTSERIL